MALENKIDLVIAEMRTRVNKLNLESTLSSYERNQMGLLASRLSENLPYGDDFDTARLEWLLIFLEGDVDWKKKYEEVFGREVPKQSEVKRTGRIKNHYRTRSEMA